MKNKNKLLSRIIAGILSLVLIFNLVMSVESKAEGLPAGSINITELEENSTSYDAEISEEDIADAEVLFELPENRTAYTKEFLLSNGLHMGAVYPEQVHYEKEGKWEDIDNTLTLKDGVFTNTAGLYSASFPEKFADEKRISFETDGEQVSFRLVNASKGDIIYKTNEEAFAKIIEKENKEIIGTLHPECTPGKLTSRLSYEKVFPETDIVYDLSSGAMKESIVLNSTEAVPERYHFELNTGEMTPVLKDSGEILLYAKETDEPAMILPAPYLVDGKDSYNLDIKVSLEGKDGTYDLIYELPTEWLYAPERVFPVILDPVVKTTQTYQSIDDTTVFENESWFDPFEGVFRVGRSTGYGIARSYVRFLGLPAITSSDVVVKAELTLCLADSTYANLPPTGGISNFIEVHKVLGAWDESTLVWHTQPAFDWTIEDTTNYYSGYLFNFDITTLVRDWYSGENNGLMLSLPQAVENNQSISHYQIEFWSGDYSRYQTVEKPTAYIYFRNNNGLENYWNYSAADAGHAGTGYVNTFTGNLAFIRSDIGFSGNRMPVSIAHTYNLNDVYAPSTGNTSERNNSNESAGNYFHMGTGWRTNYNQLLYEWIYPSGNAVGSYYIWEDSDGTDHYFRSDNGTYKDEDGLELTLTTNGSGTEKYCITDKNGNKTYFDTSGRLTKLSNNQATKSSVTVTYNGDTKEINTVTDGVGRRYVFTYSNNLLSRIAYYGTGNTVLTYQDYFYTNDNLTSVTDADGQMVYYTYDSHHLLTSVKDTDGYKLSFTFNTPTAAYQPYRVLSVEESDDSTGTNVPGGKLNFSYGDNETVITDHNGTKNVLQFNDFGNLIAAKDDKGNASFSQYAFNTDKEKTNNSNPTKKGNQLRVSSSLQYTVTNLMREHGMEGGLSEWTGVNGATVARTTSSNYTYLDSYSLQVNTTGADWDATAKGIVSDLYTVPAGKTYTFSCYVRPGTRCQVYLKAVSGDTVYTSEKVPTGTTWKRLQISFPNETSSPASVQFYVVTDDSGDFFVDAAQLEESETANRYNLVEDGDFRYGNSFPSSVGSLVSVSESGAPQLNNTVLKITGSPNTAKAVYQQIPVSGSAGDYYTLAGWGKGDSIPLGNSNPSLGTRDFSIKASFHYTDGTDSPAFRAAFNGDSKEWQYTATGMIAEKAYSRIDIALVYSYNANNAYFDGIQLYRDGFGYKYEYDSENQVISILSPSKEKDRYEYQNNNLTREILHTGSELTYTYDNYHNVLTATTDEGLCYHFTYDTYGNNTAVSITKGSETMSSEATYTSDGNFPVTESDTVGNVTTYHYNSETSVLEWVQYPNDTEDTRTEYTYDSMYRPLTVTAETNGGEELSVGYTFDTRDYLNTVTSQSTTYNLNSGIFGLRTSVSIENRTLAAYTYSNDRNHYLTGMTYGNGDFVTYLRDSEGRITKEAFEDGETVEYFYDNDGALIKTVDSESGTTETEGYDFIGRVNTYEKTNSDIAMSLTYGYDEITSRITSIRDVYNGHSRGITYLYDEDNRVTRFQQVRGFRYYTYDGFDRISSYETKFKRASDNQFFTALTTSYDYLSPEEGKTSTFVKSVTQEGLNWSDTFEYTYDGNGNILSVSDGTYTTSYVYNSANELIRENNEKIGKTYTWEYDNAGNILERKEYGYTTGSLEGVTPLDTVTYSYGDSDWGDLLTAYDGQSITYDEIGNPLSDGTWSYTWEHGRELSEMTDGESDWHFTYDADGLRTKRTNGQKTYTYAYVDGHLNYVEVNGAPYYITYAPDGTAMGIVENDVPYYFETNQQGDVIGIVTYMGAKVVEYTYDAWGNLISCTGSRANTIGRNNPIRYRGYVYDAETGLYYVSSRYYSPETGRFISPDTTDVLTATPGALTDKNLYAYCDNNPVMRSDDGGEFWHIVAGAVIGALGGAISSIVSQAVSGQSINWKAVGISAASGAIGGAITAACPCMAPLMTGVVQGTLSAVTYAATEKIAYGRDPSIVETLKVGVISGVTAGTMQYIGKQLGAVQCFAAGTLVASKDGPVSIEEIQVGDLVWATNEDTGETALKEVVQLFRNETSEWIHLTVKGEKIVCTPEHPFYSPVKGWTVACDLRAGDILVTVNGEYVVLEKVQHELLESPETTYNFEVADFHTYYVGCNFVLVHNACGFSPDQQAVLDLAKENKNNLSMKDAETLWDWAQEYGISGHGPMSGHGKRWQGWHIKIKNRHIPIFPN